MADVRGVDVTKYDNDAWQWVLHGARWQYRLNPKRGIWRYGENAAAVYALNHLHCVDDAVLFSLGYEAGAVPNPRNGEIS